MLTIEIMQKLWPHSDQHIPGLAEGVVAAAPAVFAKYKTGTPLVVAHMMAQFSLECGAGLEMEENLNYTAQRLRVIFPTHFTTDWMAQQYAHNPRRIADVAYGGRMGNKPPPSDDGWDNRGRGFSQTTGEEGYAKLAANLGVDVPTLREWLVSPDHALECGVADFILCGCLPFAEKDDILDVTKRLNGGTNGLSDRRVWLSRWKPALGV